MKTMRRLLLRAVRLGTDPAHRAMPLRDVSLRIFEGDLLAILGPPGSGKSGLLRILGLLDRPATGDIFLEGRLVTGLSDADLAELRRTTVAYVPPGCTALPTCPLLLVDDPTPEQIPVLKRLNDHGQSGAFATANPELAAHGTHICRLASGRLVIITPD